MNRNSQDPNFSDDAVLERLFAEAEPRPTPSDAVRARVRTAIYDDWQTLAGRRRRQRRMLFAAAAAAAIAAVIGTPFLLRPAATAAEVATLARSVGTIYLLGETSELQRVDSLDVVYAGQAIVTADDSRVGLLWGRGGSLRIGANTEVRFTESDMIELVNGRVYFDSVSSTGAAAAGTAALTITTDNGSVTHVGTQFITTNSDDELTVSVREGRVRLDGRFHDVMAGAGQRVTLRGSAPPELVNVSAYGPEWEWVEAVAPVPDLKGRLLYDFLAWVSRETGLEFRFESDAVERIVHRETVQGDLSDAPRIALRQSLLTADLEYEIDNGVIRIKQAGKD